ncbi:DNA-binding protein HEXBP-like [Stegodyphus dumicola]|uniref:DNA-binding protein HEXBP-like n=1 Tax=Stegodyphus dumicola TaxID=202533 RepID=UPI0015B323B5|nr:DNA-binding protein HEXBP-like [Stegodyphus dumicola]
MDWLYGAEGHIRRHCRTPQATEKKTNDLTRPVTALRRNTGERKPTLKCWNCGVKGHMRRNCRTPQSTENKIDELNRQLNAMGRERSDEKPKCWNCGAEGHLRRNCRTLQSTEIKTIYQQRRGKYMSVHSEERRLPDNEKTCFKALALDFLQ